MSPSELAITLPCSDESSSASSFVLASMSRSNSNMTRARRCGSVEAEPGRALAEPEQRIDVQLVSKTRLWPRPAGVRVEDVAEIAR